MSTCCRHGTSKKSSAWGSSSPRIPTPTSTNSDTCINRDCRWSGSARAPRCALRPTPGEKGSTRAEALRCATVNGAYLTFDEDKKGSLEPGKLADLAVLSDDPLTVAEPGLRDITADMTMVGGKMVHQTPTWPG